MLTLKKITERHIFSLFLDREIFSFKKLCIVAFYSQKHVTLFTAIVGLKFLEKKTAAGS